MLCLCVYKEVQWTCVLFVLECVLVIRVYTHAYIYRLMYTYTHTHIFSRELIGFNVFIPIHKIYF